MEETIEYSLRRIREDFGWSQVDLANRIGVAETTLRRWEKKRTKEPIISAITRKTNRRLHYLLAMVDRAILDRVENSNDFVSLHHGDDLMTVALSKGYVESSPELKMLIGVPVSTVLVGTAAQHFRDNTDMIKACLRRPGSTGYWVTEDIKLPALVQRGKVMHLKVLAPGLALAEGRNTEPGDLPARIEFNMIGSSGVLSQ